MAKYATLKTAMAALFATGLIGMAATSIPASTIAAEPTSGQDDASEFAKLSGVKIGLADAIAAAEKQFGGKAVNAALDNEQASASFEVELMTESGSKTVSVDGKTGDIKPVADSSGDGLDVE